MERQLLSALLSTREAYDKLSPYLIDDDFSDQGKIIYSHISEFYEADPHAGSVDTELLQSSLARKYEKHADRFKHIVNSLSGDVSSPNVIKEFFEFKKQAIGTKLSSALLSYDQKKVDSLIDEYERYRAGDLSAFEEDKKVFNSTSIGDIVNSVTGDNLIKLYPKSLNDHVDGGVPRGTHIGLFARPETGKSMVSINMACGFCHDGLRVAYVGNEDPAPSMLLRFISRMSGMTKYEITRDPELASELAIKNGYDNLYFMSTPSGTLKEIRELLEEVQPDVLIVDQIRQLYIPGVKGDVEQLTRAAKGLRQLGKEFDIVTISVTQAGESADKKLVLEMGDVYMSNTTVAGDVDLMIGVGVNDVAEQNNIRVLSLCKNKINSDHSHFEVVVDPTLSKVISR